MVVKDLLPSLLLFSIWKCLAHLQETEQLAWISKMLERVNKDKPIDIFHAVGEQVDKDMGITTTGRNIYAP